MVEDPEKQTVTFLVFLLDLGLELDLGISSYTPAFDTSSDSDSASDYFWHQSWNNFDGL